MPLTHLILLSLLLDACITDSLSRGRHGLIWLVRIMLMCIVLFLIRVIGMYIFLGVSNVLGMRLFIQARQVSYDLHLVLSFVYIIEYNRLHLISFVRGIKKATVVSILYKQFRPPIVRSRNGKTIQCTGGETFSSLDVVTSFNQSNSIANRFIDH